MEWKIRIESVNKNNSHSWVRISHGLSKLVTDLSNKEYDDNEQETSEMKSEEFALKTNVLALAVGISHPYLNLVEPACSHMLVSVLRTSFST